jgi:8-hydroxy-5-deazaflavin:NADPH oxidoreductase
MDTKKKIGVLGSGTVGQVLADGFLKHGYQVMRGTRDPAKLGGWLAGAGAEASTGTFAEAAAFGDMVVLAVKGTAAEDVVRAAGDGLNGKPVLDATNPIADAPPQNGVIAYFTGPNDSLMERLQKLAPAAHFVKAFSCVGNALMIDPKLSSRPSMFICGNDAGAKEATRALLDQLGWDTEDMGPVEAARAIEPLCMLWCIPGFARNDWMHAFKMIRP